MRNAPNLRAEKYRELGPPNTNCGMFRVVWRGTVLQVIASDGGGWDHVSVSRPDRCATWEEMGHVKDLFFYDNEVVMQLHPAKDENISNHPFCLHLWRPQTDEDIAKVRAAWGDEWLYGDLKAPGTIPLPPPVFVGIKGVRASQVKG